MNIGILYPRSKAHPGITQDLLDGLKTFIKQHELDKEWTLFSESIGIGGAEKEVYEKAEKLLIIDDVDVLVAYIDLRVMPILEPLFYTSAKPVIIVNPGANFPQNWIPQPNTMFLTLQHAFLCSLTGHLASDAENGRAGMTTTFYDCGYLHTAAMVKSFSRSGGIISFNYVNNQLYNDDFNIKELADLLSSDKTTHSLLCVFDELPASLLYDQLNAFDDAGDLHLFVSPMMLQQKALEKLPGGFKFSVDGYLPWDFSSTNEANTFFKDSYQKQAKKNAGIFSLLGWETGMILQQVAIGCKDNIRDGAKVVETLAGTKIPGPRGELKLDPATNYFISPVVRCSVKNNSDKIEMTGIGFPEHEWKTFSSVPIEGVTSGWTNTYLCY